jgi:peptidyl-prolyl cis-trans isomerase SurA
MASETHMKKLISWSVLVCLTALPAFSANQVIEEVIARVNNRIITLSDYKRSQEETRQEAQQQDAAHADQVYQEREKDILRDLIDHQLLLEKAAELGITGDTELIKWLDNMRKEMKLDTMEDLEKAATAQGVSFEDFKQNQRNQIVMQEVIRREVGSRLGENITKEDEQRYYNDHKKELEHAEQVRLSEILVVPAKGDVDPSVPADKPEAHPAAKAKAESLLAQIRKGANFEEIAKKNSDGPTAAQGGDLGDFQRGTLSKQYEDQVFAMKTGDVSDVVYTKQGFVIMKATEHLAAGIPSFKEIEPRIEEAIYMERLQPALREYLTRLREEAYIPPMKPGYVDTGASPNQTTVVETNQAEAKAKKLAKKKKKFKVF